MLAIGSPEPVVAARRRRGEPRDAGESVKGVLSIREIADKLGVSRRTAIRLLRQMGVPIHRAHPRGKGWIWLSELRDVAPEAWASCLEAVHVRSLQ